MNKSSKIFFGFLIYFFFQVVIPVYSQEIGGITEGELLAQNQGETDNDEFGFNDPLGGNTINNNQADLLNEAQNIDSTPDSDNLEEFFSADNTNEDLPLPMENVFFNTIFGGATGIFLGVTYATFFEGLGTKDGDLRTSAHTIVGLAVRGAFVGMIIGTVLSFTDITFSDDNSVQIEYENLLGSNLEDNSSPNSSGQYKLVYRINF